MHTRTRRSPRAVPRRAPADLWGADCASFAQREWRGLSGYLVTERGQPDRLIAYVDCQSHVEAGGLGIARRIAADPSALDSPDLLAEARELGPDVLTDLRRCGRPDSPEIVPGFVFALLCRRAGPDGRPHGPTRVVSPFCRFRLVEMCEVAGWGLVRESENKVLWPSHTEHADQRAGSSPMHWTDKLIAHYGRDKKAAPTKPAGPQPASERDRKAARGAA
jgi:hypothetical protein